jgi:hypothetical protein
MKNIHILKTDKPSRLQLQMNGNFHIENGQSITLRSYQHMYITSNEEIKVGDWCIDEDGLKKCTSHAGAMNHYFQKIILTSDTELVKDGIQSIPDEFLEWFVKNPSCEYVEVKKESEFYRSGPLDLLGHNIITYKINIPEKITRCCGRCNGVDDLCYSDMTCDNHKERGCEICYGKRIEYKIIIPKEEPKQTVQEYEQQGLEKHSYELELKQETLEEVVKKELEDYNNLMDDLGVDGEVDYRELKQDEFDLKSAINWAKFGANWQAERSYNEEEVFNLCREFAIFVQRKGSSYKKQQKWFEQFKKK